MKKFVMAVMMAAAVVLALALWNHSGNAPSAISTAKTESGSAPTETPVYKKWTMVSEQKVNFPITGPTLVDVSLKGFIMRTYVEKPADQESNWAEEISLGSRVFLRTTVGKGAEEYNGLRTYELLVNGKWLTGKPGVLPKLYLLDYVALFEKNEMKGVRITMELADGTSTETTLL